MRKPIIALLVAGGMSLAAVAADRNSSRPANDDTTLSELSGVLHKEAKAIMPHLELDGSQLRCYVRGEALAVHERGTRLYVRGTLRSELLDFTGGDWSKPGAPAPPPFRKGWVVYLDVKEAREIAEPFQRPDHPATVKAPATTRSAHERGRKE